MALPLRYRLIDQDGNHQGADNSYTKLLDRAVNLMRLPDVSELYVYECRDKVAIEAKPVRIQFDE